MFAAVISLIVAFFVGGGWYLADKIRSEALAVESAAAMPAYDDVQIVEVSSGQVQLRAIGDEPALVKPELYGIAWQGGIGRLGASAAVSGDVVTRPLTVTVGLAPSVGQLAGLDKSFFLGDPRTALGIPVQDVVVEGPLGPLPAWYFPGHGSTFVVGVHGQNGARRDALRVVDIAHRMGFPALAVTYRNDLDVAHDPSGYLRYGQTEWRDLEAALRWSFSHGARRVVLVGQSMGGAIVAAFLVHSVLAPKVARVVLDAPMLDLHAAVDNRANRRGLPMIGRVPAPLVWTAERIASVRFGVDWSATSYLDNTTWLKVPALVTHGGDDTKVPISISSRLKDLKPSLVRFAEFADAGHLESWNIDRARYTSLLESFLAPVAPCGGSSAATVDELGGA
jgi:pimeloyl-ACP methyl ester carboxylesterase